MRFSLLNFILGLSLVCAIVALLVQRRVPPRIKLEEDGRIWLIDYVDLEESRWSDQTNPPLLQIGDIHSICDNISDHLNQNVEATDVESWRVETITLHNLHDFDDDIWVYTAKLQGKRCAPPFTLNVGESQVTIRQSGGIPDLVDLRLVISMQGSVFIDAKSLDSTEMADIILACKNVFDCKVPAPSPNGGIF